MNNKISQQRDFYNSRWENYDYINTLKLQRCISILNGILKTKIQKPRICDLGCGSGWLTGVVGIIGPSVGVDLSEKAILNSRKKFPYVDYFFGDIYTWNHVDEKFDIVISQEVIEHVEHQDKYLDIACNLLRDGGYLILTTPNKKVFNWFPEEKKLKWTNQPIENWLSKKDLQRMLDNKFEILELTTIIPGYEYGPVLRLLNSNKLHSLLSTLGLFNSYNTLRLKSNLGLHIYLLARKRLLS